MTFARTKIQPPQPRAAFVERGALQTRQAAAPAPSAGFEAGGRLVPGAAALSIAPR